MKNKMKYILVVVLFSVGLFSCQNAEDVNMSSAMKRYFAQWNGENAATNEFYTSFKYMPVKGFEYEEGVSRRDPSTIIKVDGTYYVYYTRSQKMPKPVGYLKATKTVPANAWDLCDIWYATSEDGKTWKEQGMAAKRGPEGEFDDRSVFTADIMIYKNKYYLYYQAVKAPYRNRSINVIGMSWADSPSGPWYRHPEPVLEPGTPGVWAGEEDDRTKISEYGAFDSHKVHDPNLIIRDGEIWLYYKAVPMGTRGELKKPYPDISMGLAIAENPEGPFEKHPLSPVANSGHEALVWPYKEGVATLITANGQEKNTVQWAKDGVNFEVKSHIILPPDAAGLYCPDKHTDTKDGKGFTWGLSHIEKEQPWSYIIGFECDLTGNTDRRRFKKENIRFDAKSRFNAQK